MKNRIKVSLALIFLLGCATADLSIRKNYDFKKLSRVGVITFSTAQGKRGKEFGQLAADQFSLELLTVGFSMIERSQIEKVVDELNLGQTGLIDPTKATEVGQIAGIDAVVIGSITPALKDGSIVVQKPSRRRARRRPRTRVVKKPPHRDMTDINMTAKMILVETGEILWVSTVQRKSDDLQTSIKFAVKSIAKKLNKNLEL